MLVKPLINPGGIVGENELKNDKSLERFCWSACYWHKEFLVYSQGAVKHSVWQLWDFKWK